VYSIIYSDVTDLGVTSRLYSIVRDDRGVYASYDSALLYLARIIDRRVALV
jgi:hypothetical protein